MTNLQEFLTLSTEFCNPVNFLLKYFSCETNCSCMMSDVRALLILLHTYLYETRLLFYSVSFNNCLSHNKPFIRKLMKTMMISITAALYCPLIRRELDHPTLTTKAIVVLSRSKGNVTKNTFSHRTCCSNYVINCYRYLQVVFESQLMRVQNNIN